MKTCLHCGKELTSPKQKKFCSKSCSGMHNRKTPKIVTCKGCGIKFKTTSWNQQYCTRSCASSENKSIKHNDKALNRPYTKETAYLIRLWFSKGNSKAEIAQILGRSLESVEKAFV